MRRTVLAAAVLAGLVILAVVAGPRRPTVVLTVVVGEPLLSSGGTVVMLVTRLDQNTFDRRYGHAIAPQDGEIRLRVAADSAVTFVEFDAPPDFQYNFRTAGGTLVAAPRVSAGEGGGYRDITTDGDATSDTTFHHHIAGPDSEEATSRAPLGSFFRINPASCRTGPAVRACSGSSEDLARMLLYFRRSAMP